MLARYVSTGHPLPSHVPEANPSPPLRTCIPLLSRGNKINRIHIEHDDKIYWKLVSNHSVVPTIACSHVNHTYTPWRYHSTRIVMEITYTRTVVVSSNSYNNANYLSKHPTRTVMPIIFTHTVPFNAYRVR